MAKRPVQSGTLRSTPRQARSQERVNHILDVAETMFVAQGYAATTTNAIAKQAGVPIGSLYQFFSDKKAIVVLLMERYNRLLHERLALVDNASLAALPLPEYVDLLIEITSRFFDDYPGYHAIFMETQSLVPEVRDAEDAADAQLIRDLATSLRSRGLGRTENQGDGHTSANLEMIALVLVKAVTPLIWFSSLQAPEIRQALVTEIKRLALGYLTLEA